MLLASDAAEGDHLDKVCMAQKIKTLETAKTVNMA